MPKSNTLHAVERLVFLVNSGHVEPLKQALADFEQSGLHKEKLINYPIQRYNGRTAVHLAASSGLVDCLGLLLKSGGNPNALSSPPDLSQTPLHLAASMGYPHCIEILLEHGARMDIKNAHRSTAYNLVRGKVKCEKVFHLATARFQIPQRTNDQQKRVEALHELVGITESLDDFYSYYEQLPHDHKDLATRWTDFYQQTLLYRAASCEQIDIVRFILSKSSSQPLHNLDTNETSVIAACRRGNFDILKLLLQHSPKLVFISEARQNLSPLHVACSRGNSQMTELILQAIKSYAYSDDHNRDTEISLDFRDQLGRTPLYNACYYGYYNVAKMIIEFQQESPTYFSLSVNTAVKNSQRTPLHVAVRKGNWDIARLLLSVKSIDFSLEARPSGRTQAKLLASYQMMCRVEEEASERSFLLALSGKANHQDDGDREGSGGGMDIEDIKSRELLMCMDAVSPPGTRSPLIESSMFSSLTSSDSKLELSSSFSPVSTLHIDDSVGFTAPAPSAVVNRKGLLSESTTLSSGIKRSTSKKLHKSHIMDGRLPLKDRENIFGIRNSHKENGKRPLTDSILDSRDTLGEVIFENRQSGKLEVLRVEKGSEASGYKNFDHIFMTPLVEAVACGHFKIIKLLLAHGARDDSGLACRIAHFVKKLDLMQLILAHHTMLHDDMPTGLSRSGTMDEKGERTGGSDTSMRHLELHWGHKKLPLCGGRWFLLGEKFYPNFVKDEDGRASVIGEGLTSNTVSREDREEDITGDSSSMESSFEEGLLPGPRLAISVDAIRVVQLDKNQLQSVPLQIFQLSNVRKIDLSQNRITELPTRNGLQAHFTGKLQDNDVYASTCGWTCPCLEELNISANQLTFLPYCVWHLNSLRKLICAKNKLACLYPEGVLNADEVLSLSLESIDLSHNCLKSILSEFIFEFPSLKILHLSDNMIEELPEKLWLHAKLQEINLANNQIKCLPLCEPELVYRDSLSMHRLNPAPAPMQQADIVLVGKAAICAPSIDRNMAIYQRAPSSIQPLNTNVASHSSMAVVYSYNYSSLQKLNISGNRFTMFPEALPCFAPNLHELDISRNPGLKEIDVMFIPFSLKKLTVKSCGLVRIGNVVVRKRQIQSMQNCRHMDDAGRSCTHRSHNRLPWVTSLDLSQNKVVHLQLIRQHNPETELGLVEQIEMEYDVKIAPSLDLLYPALEGLNLTDNHLAGMFNPNIGHQMHLKWIRLSKNHDLTGIPMEFAYLKKTKQLSELRMEHLPNLVEPPVEYQQVRLNHLLTYMRSRLKESDYYRSIKLFFVGNGERGKTTLLRRLRGIADDKKVDRTVGIDIVSWVYCPDKKRLLFKEKRKPVQFLALDFAGQDVYHTTHQCFYSRRSMYIALFRLTDGQEGIEELEPWLRNIQLRAPGCPVIIVGTHLDAMTDLNRVKELETNVWQKYANTAHYPKVVGVVSISCIKKFFSTAMDDLRNTLYNMACHLSLGSDGTSLEYKPNMSETDPKALFQQQIPRTFLTLQEKIGEKVLEMKENGIAPIMEDSEFKSTFKSLVEDEEELNEAVYFLNLQGTLLHFEDHTLKSVYFLDPEWLAKLMADVIHPAAMGKASHIHNGVAQISGLFSQRDMPLSMKDHYISLLEKFEVALKINSDQMIIPSLMPDQSSYPKPNDILSDIAGPMLDALESYQPPFRRFWLADYMPDGFWPRLICRVATDPQISRVFRVVMGKGNRVSPSESPLNLSPVISNRKSVLNGTSNLLMPPAAYGRRSPSVDRVECHEILNWTPWKTGIALAHRGRTLLVMKQVSNHPSSEFRNTWGTSVPLLKSEYRIEIHIYTNEWVTMSIELLELNLPSSPLEGIPGLATKLLVMLTGHVKTLATTFFAGMLSLPRAGVFSTYVPCWKCFAEIGSPKDLCVGNLKGLFVSKGNYPVSTYVLEDHIVTAVMNSPLECCFHGDIEIVHMTPDLIFWDLTSDMAYQDNTTPLHICEDEVLGKGGFGFVCKGELKLTADNFAEKKNVAVKFFLQDVTQLLETSSISELLKSSRETKHLLYAYREIRQEVCFLSNFDHPHLANLCGVRTTPYLCLMLELAPKKSLHAILKEYKELQVALEPLTLKNAALQIAQGLEYLHSNQIVHLDMKSPNVLLWHFPSPRESRSQRMQQSGNVWLKIADYGISQVSTGLSLRVDNAPVGTPGFMAPELFERAGQVISADKVDVFAYGMVLFELISQRSPFGNIHPPVKRNSEVKDGKRPILDVRETRSPLLLQELMFVCWEHDPYDRPRMEQVVEWILAPEFERLRAEISLNDVKSISCACVCRLRPEYEVSLTLEKENSFREDTEPVYNGFVDFDDVHVGKDIDEIGNLDSLVEKYGGGKDDGGGLCGIDLIVQNMLTSVPLESACIENSEGKKISNSDEDIYQFLPSLQRRGISRSSNQRKRRTTGNRRRKMKSELFDKEVSEANASATNFDPYTQIWMCGRDQRKGLLQILTFNDGHSGYYHFNGYCSHDEITSLCPVRNMMWMGTTSGMLKVFHAPTLKVKFTCTLEREGPEGTTNRTILDILYVEEIRTVLIANFSGEVWSFYDTIVDDGLRLQCKIALRDDSPCYHLVKVVLDSGKLEVWGTMENNRLLLLEHNPVTTWKHDELIIAPKDPKLRLCSYVAFASFTTDSGEGCKHVWISYRQRSVLVSFDANTKKQRCILNCADKLKQETSQTFQVTNLICSGCKVMVGTSIGTVGIFNSETLDVIQLLSWHKDKVRMLLVMPQQVDACICAEVPFPDQAKEKCNCGNKKHGMESPLTTGRKQFKSIDSITHKNTDYSSQCSYLDNKYCILNPEPESRMITSIGNGRCSYSVHTQTKEDQVQIFNKAALRKTAHKVSSRQKWDDIVLRTWRI